MSTILRRTGRIAAQSLRAPRRTYLPRQRLSPQCIYAQSRRYASVQPGPPEEPNKSENDEKKKLSEKKDGKKKLDAKKDGEVEGSEKDAESSTTDLQPGHVRLSKKEEQQLDEIITDMMKSMPEDFRAQGEAAKAYFKKHGIPEEFQSAINKRKRGESLSVWEVVQLTRAAAKYIITPTPETRDPQQKSGAHDPGPQDEKKWEKGRVNFGPGKKKDDKSKDEKTGFSTDQNLFWLAALASYLLYRVVVPGEASREITWQEFRNTFLDKGLVEKVVVVNQNRAKVYLHRESVASMYPESPATQAGFVYYFSIGSVEAFERKMEQAQAELGIPNHERIPVAYASEGSWMNYVLSFGPTLLFIGAIFFFSKRAASGAGGSNGIFGMGRSRAKKFNHESDVKVKFSDVAGMDEAKTEIMEFVSFLKEPGIYQKLGAKIPRGAILSGPPGTGKTLLAKATAGESGVPFFSVSGSEFVEMFVGVGPSRVRDLFANARKSTPCIIFIDEIDAIGKSRSKNNFGGGNDERESTLNQILTEMDGFNTSEQVVVLAGTNRPDVLDKALMRPGRFDRHIAIDRPTLEGRKQIFAVHLKKIVTKEDLEHLGGRLASLTPGFSGADIANCVNEAALVAARFMAESVEITHFEQAIERVIVGLEKKSLVLSPEEKRTVAYHEAGHAICGWFFEWADPLLKVSIIPRGQGALGYAQYLPSSDNYLMNVNQLMDRMAMTLGGRVSEELHFDTVTTGASDDFKKVTQMATAMVTKWGMTKKVGFLYFEDDPQSQMHKPFSEETAKNIDVEVRRIVDEAYTQCRNMLIERKAELELVAEELLKKEMIGRDDLIRILGPRPFPDKGEWSKYFGSKGDKEGSDFGTPAPSGPGKQEGGTLGAPGTPTPAMFKRR